MSKFVTFRQADSRWGNMPYPKSPYYVKDVGCGPTACASIIYNIKRDITPKETANWMLKHGYALPGNGTAAKGITECLKAYGYKVGVHNNMSSFWAACNAGNVAGIIWFRKGAKGGVTWTTTGHYVAFSGYKVENGKHYLYTRDPGGRHNDGWHCYETQMFGLIVELWTVNVPGQSTVEEKTQYYKTYQTMNVRKGASVNYKVVGSVPRGAVIKTTKVSGNWVYTPGYNGVYGWICVKDSNHIYMAPTEDPTKVVYYKTTMVMNVRRGASARYKIVGTVPKGAKIKTTKVSGDWVYTPGYNGVSGWICVKDKSYTYLIRQ